MKLEERFKSELTLIERHLDRLFVHDTPAPLPELNKFWESLNYSLLSGGKRFRPLLSLLTAKALDKPMDQALPMALAVELIHTYSLIHDDLPCMDNDDFRRGRPTNHKVYGEAQALLAGDALLTCAFGVLAGAKSENIGEAVRRLSRAAGPIGMVGGQALDIAANDPSENLLNEIHKRKTGALIAVAVSGTAVLLGAPADSQTSLEKFGERLGLAFQLADDIQDHSPDRPEKVNYVSRLGLDGTRRKLEEVSEQAIECLGRFPNSADDLREMVRLNLQRV